MKTDTIYIKKNSNKIYTETKIKPTQQINK